MRLMHAGFKSYVVGEMVTPPVGPGTFLVKAGPGHFPTVETLKVARGMVATAVTAQPERAAQMPVDLVIHLPAQTMVDIAAGRAFDDGSYEASSCCLAICRFCAFSAYQSKPEDMARHQHEVKVPLPPSLSHHP